MLDMIDSHVHSTLSPDSRIDLREGCAKAVEIGIDKLAFTNHFAVIGSNFKNLGEFFNEEEQSGILEPPFEFNPSIKQWRAFNAEFPAARKQFPQLQLAFGIEADFFPPLLSESRKFLNELPFDFVLGSVHYLGNKCVSMVNGCKAYLEENSVETYLKHYFELERAAAASGWFDSMSHLDYCLKNPVRLGYKIAFEEYSEFAFKAIDEMAARGVAIEVNSAGARRLGRPFPSIELLEYAAQAGVPGVTLGSDAHELNELGFGLKEAVQLAQKAGFENALFFMNRELEEIPLSSLL